jgi:hypothetical protein
MFGRKKKMSGRLKSLLLGATGAAALTVSTAGIAFASSDEPAVNLGLTSFNDGFGGLTPGWAFMQYDFFIGNNAITGDNGKKIGEPVFNSQHVNVYVSLQQLIYVSPLHLFGGTLGATALLPITELNATSNSPAFVHLRSNGLGLGDATLGVFLQEPPIIMGGRPVFDYRFEVDGIVPTGSYNDHKDANQGGNFYSLNPYFTFTVLPIPGLEISGRENYLLNGKNNDPGVSPDGPAPGSSFTAGQAWWTNFDASYTILPGLDVGFNGYYFKQFTDDVTDGVTTKGTETTLLSAGPGATYAYNKTNIFWFNVYLPVEAKNSTSGERINFRWIHIF